MKRKAFALITVLLMSGVMVMLVMALFASVRGGMLNARTASDQEAALNTAEAGVADAIAQLEMDNAWVLGFNRKATPWGGGEYSVDFYTGTGMPGPDDSVNNLLSDAPRATPLGDIPPHSALLVATGRVRGSQRRVEALVRGGGATVDAPLVAAGRVDFKGGLKVDGIESLETNTPIQVEVHSNKTGAGTMMTWQKLVATDRAVVTGKVTSSGSDPTAIVFNPNVAPDCQVAGFATDAPQKPAPSFDVESAVAAKSGSPGPAVPAVGTLVLPTGDYYYAGNTSIDGDLVLQDDARVYVHGDLRVNGTITGKGAVLVTGATDLRGDATVSTRDSDYVALMSRGAVSLRGFDGTAYLASLAAADPPNPATPPGQETSELWDGLQTGVRELNTIIATYPPDQYVGDGVPQQVRFDNARGTIGLAAGYVMPGYADDNAGKLRDRMPAGPTGAFLRDKLDALHKTYRAVWADANGNAVTGWSPADCQAVIDKWLAGTLTDADGGVWDAVTTLAYDPSNSSNLSVLNQQLQVTLRTDYDRMGESYFKGLVYSNGAIYAGHEVTIVGALYTDDDHSQGPVVLDGVPLQPGDVHLGSGTRVTYVRSMFEDGIPSLGAAGALGVVTWISR